MVHRRRPVVRSLPMLLGAGLLIAGCATPSAGPSDGHVPIPEQAPGEGTEGEADHAPTPAGTSGDADPDVPDLSGRWVLDAKASDDLQETLQAAVGQMRGAMGGGKGMGGSRGRGRGGGMGGGGRGRGASGGMTGGSGLSPGELSSLLDTGERLEIEHEDPMLSITGPDGNRRRIFTDFRGASVSTSGGLDQRVTVAGWEDDVLVVEMTPGNGPRVIQHYRLDERTGRLVIRSQVLLQRLPEPLAIRQVYQPLPKDAAAEAGPHPQGRSRSSPSVADGV